MTIRFWQRMEALIASSPLVIDRPKGWAHPSYPALIYPLDYGYLDGTTTSDGGGIDVWRGSREDDRLEGLICTVDLEKRDAEIKLLVGCTEEETQTALRFQNQGRMAGVLVRRDD